MRSRVAFAWLAMSGIAGGFVWLPRSPSCLADDPPPVATQQDQAGKPAEQQPAPAATQPGAASPSPALLEQLLTNLTPEHMQQFGQMLEQDWKTRPEWGEMAVAVLKGQRMGIGSGWWRESLKRYDWSWFQGHYDVDRDGQVTRNELPSDLPQAEQIFDRLDRNLDGRITSADLDPNEPGGPMSPSNMATMLFSRLDKDSNGRLSLQELAEFFAKADREDLGFLTPDDLRATLFTDTESQRPSARAQGPDWSPAEMLRMFLTGQMGWLESGPNFGEVAPDFTLTTHDGARSMTLSESRGKRPVVLIFGSFT